MGVHNPTNDKYISEVAELTSPTGNEIVPISDSGVPKNIKISNINTDAFLDLSDVNLTSFNEGRIPFETATGLTDSAELFWDETNKRLGVGSSSPNATLDVRHSNGAQGLAVFTAGVTNNWVTVAGIPTLQVIGSVAYFGSGATGGTYLGSNGYPVGININPVAGQALTIDGITVTKQLASQPDPEPGFDSIAALANGDIEGKSNVGGEIITSTVHDHSDTRPVGDLRYFGQVNWNADGQEVSRNLVTPMYDRLFGSTSRFTVTAQNNYSGSLSNLFAADVNGSVRFNANQAAIIEIDFNPSVSWTVDSNSGFVYAGGLMVFNFYNNQIAHHIKIENYKPVGGIDQWVTSVDDDVTGARPEIVVPESNFNKKLRITLSQPAVAANSEIWLASIEYAVWRPSISYGKDQVRDLPSLYTVNELQVIHKYPARADDAGASDLQQHQIYRRPDGSLAQKL